MAIPRRNFNEDPMPMISDAEAYRSTNQIEIHKKRKKDKIFAFKFVELKCGVNQEREPSNASELPGE